MSADIIQFIPKPNPSRFAESCNETGLVHKSDLSALVPFAKSGGPITDHNDYACSDSNPQDSA